MPPSVETSDGLELLAGMERLAPTLNPLLLFRMTLRAVADGLNVVAVRVNDIAAVVVGVVLRAKTRRAVVTAACGEGRGVERIDGRAVWRGKRDVHGCRGVAARDEEVNTPWRAEADSLDLGDLDSEWRERGLVELPARCHVTDGDGEMVNERHALDFTKALDIPEVPGQPPSRVLSR
jgi:hypothetical protein